VPTPRIGSRFWSNNWKGLCGRRTGSKMGPQLSLSRAGSRILCIYFTRSLSVIGNPFRVKLSLMILATSLRFSIGISFIAPRIRSMTAYPSLERLRGRGGFGAGPLLALEMWERGGRRRISKLGGALSTSGGSATAAVFISTAVVISLTGFGRSR